MDCLLSPAGTNWEGAYTRPQRERVGVGRVTISGSSERIARYPDHE